MTLGKLYRYEDQVYSTVSISVSGYETYGTTPVQLNLLEFDIVKETPKGYWISYAFANKWVPRPPHGRFAQPTKRMALERCLQRKRRQLQILETRVARVRNVLSLIYQEQSKL